MASISKIERAHQMYRDGYHEEALRYYTEALTMAKTKAQKIALHSNRAACFLKLQDFKKSLAPIPESEEEAIGAESEEEEIGDELEEEATVDELEEEATALEAEIDKKHEHDRSNLQVTITQNFKDPSDLQPKGWEAIPKPKGHSRLDYSLWNKVAEDDSSDEEDEEDEPQPQYRFRVRTVGIRPVK